MNFKFHKNGVLVALCTISLAISAAAQGPDGPPRPRNGEQPPPRGDGPPPGGGRGGGFGPPGGAQPDIKLLKKYDQNKDKILNPEERKAAREFLKEEEAAGRIRRGPRGGFGRGGEGESTPPKPGPKLTPADVKSYPDAPLYDTKVLRTLFLDFESADWEKELADFRGTDVEVPAKMTVDGKVLKDVGVHFRGASSYFTVREGMKRSLNVSLDMVHEDQNIGGYRTLNLLNSHTDPTFVRSVLYYQVARDYIPAPKANYVRVVINGESWGVYVNAQQFNKDLVNDWFKTTKGARWKVPGSPRGRGSLSYLGEDVEEYKKIYEIKTKEDPKAWTDLIKLCKVLTETPADKLEKELAPRLDVDGVLKFLALENALINSDGYWIRSSDYNIYQDPEGRFHIIPHDSNETFSPAGRGPGGFGGGGQDAGVKLDPLAGADDTAKPLLNRLLSVPSLRARYFGYVKDIAERWLDWKKLSPLIQEYQSLIAADVKADTRKLEKDEAFVKSVAEDYEEQGPRGSRQRTSLKTFVEQRREFLLNHPEVKQAAVPAKVSAQK